MERRSQSFVGSTWRTIALTIGLCMGIWALVRTVSPISSYEISPERIQIAEGDVVLRPRRFQTRDNMRPLSAQFRPRQGGSIRYAHFTFDEAELNELPHSLWIEGAGNGLEVLVNNARMGPGRDTRFSPIGTTAQSARIELPRFVLVPGINRVTLYTSGDPTRGGTGNIYLAPTTLAVKAQARYAWRDRWAGPVALAIGLTGLLLSLFAFVLQPKQVSFLALSCVALGQSWISQSPFHAGPVWLILLGVMAFVLTRQRAVGRFMVPITVSLTLAALGSGLALVRAYAPVDWVSPMLVYNLLFWCPLPLLIGPPGRTVLAWVRALRPRLAALEGELVQTRRDLSAESQRRAVLEERERLMRDIHDGVGGQLLGLLLRLRTGELPRKVITRDLQAGLHDLRLIVDAIDHTGNDLGVALSAFRDHAQHQLGAAGIDLTWTQAADLGPAPQGRDAVLHLYRILQEALTNAIRHSGGSQVGIDIAHTDDALVVRVSDDGRGRAGAKTKGRGTLNMRRRADLLKGTINMEDSPDAGHVVTLRVPIPKAQSAA